MAINAGCDQVADSPNHEHPVSPSGHCFRGEVMTTKVLFVCTGNSCRSQMAEGWLRALSEGSVAANSAGISPHGQNPGPSRSWPRLGWISPANLRRN